MLFIVRYCLMGRTCPGFGGDLGPGVRISVIAHSVIAGEPSPLHLKAVTHVSVAWPAESFRAAVESCPSSGQDL